MLGSLWALMLCTPALAGLGQLSEDARAAAELLETCRRFPAACSDARDSVAQAMFIQIVDDWVQRGELDEANVADLLLLSPARFQDLPPQLQRASEPHDWVVSLEAGPSAALRPATAVPPRPEPRATPAESIPSAVTTVPPTGPVDPEPRAETTPEPPGPDLATRPRVQSTGRMLSAPIPRGMTLPGECEVEIWIGADGRTEQVVPAGQCDSPELFDDARRTVWSWRWQPTTDERGAAIRSWTPYTHRVIASATIRPRGERDREAWTAAAARYELLPRSDLCYLLVQVVPDDGKVKVSRMASNDPDRCGFIPRSSRMRFPSITETTHCDMSMLVFDQTTQDRLRFEGCQGVARHAAGLFHAGHWSPWLPWRTPVIIRVEFVPA